MKALFIFCGRQERVVSYGLVAHILLKIKGMGSFGPSGSNSFASYTNFADNKGKVTEVLRICYIAIKAN